MDRADATGLGIALAAHAALAYVLSLGLAKASLPPVQTQPMEVEFVEEVGLVSAAPEPSAAEPATRLGEPEPVSEPLPAAPPQVQPLPQPLVAPVAPPPQPAPRAQLQPQPKAPAPKPKAPPPKAAPQPKPAARPSGRLSGLLNGVSERESPSRSTARPAATAGPAVKSSLARAVREQLKPHWKAPTGADADQLRTELSIWLSPSGTVTRVEVIATTGQTSSNRPQVKLHQEQAVRAVRLASPFRLPSEYYEVWKQLSPIGFDKRLSQ
jgi:outer membrane biosynthesis protein TonB